MNCIKRRKICEALFEKTMFLMVGCFLSATYLLNFLLTNFARNYPEKEDDKRNEIILLKWRYVFSTDVIKKIITFAIY